MGNINGEWVILGLDENDPDCIHNIDEAEKFIEKIGFLPLFANSIPGFSLEEHTAKDYWWSGNEEKDPWEWRRIIASRQKIAYGKFFNGKAGFITLKWLPYFVNWRRDGYDFDTLWEIGMAKQKEKKIMECFDNYEELPSFRLKSISCLKDADLIASSLQDKIYLVTSDFRQKINKNGEPYGWASSIYTTPEKLWGYESVTKAYAENPEESKSKIFEHIISIFPQASEKSIKKELK